MRGGFSSAMNDSVGIYRALSTGSMTCSPPSLALPLHLHSLASERSGAGEGRLSGGQGCCRVALS